MFDPNAGAGAQCTDTSIPHPAGYDQTSHAPDPPTFQGNNNACGVTPNEVALPNPDGSVNVTAMDKTEFQEWNNANEASVAGGQNPAEFMEKIRESANGNQINNVDIIDHGNQGYQTMGQPYPASPDVRHMTGADDQMYSDLGQQMTPGGQINLRGCDVGGGEAGTEYLMRVATDSGHTANAATQEQYPSEPGNNPAAQGQFQGPVKTVNADGTVGITDPNSRTSLPLPSASMPDPVVCDPNQQPY
jgi:hypothetical protein